MPVLMAPFVRTVNGVLVPDSQGSAFVHIVAGTGNTQTTAECVPSTSSSHIPFHNIDERDERYPASQEVHIDLAAFDLQSQVLSPPNSHAREANILRATEEPSVEPMESSYADLCEGLGVPLTRMLVPNDPSHVSIAPSPTHKLLGTRHLSIASTSPMRDTAGTENVMTHLGTKRNRRQPSVGSEDSFAGSDDSPRNAQDFIRRRTRLEEEQVHAGDVDSSRLGKDKGRIKRLKQSKERNQDSPSRGKITGKEAISPNRLNKSPSAPWVPPSSPRIPLRSKTALIHPTTSLDPKVFVESTPTNSNSHSSGLSNPNPISQISNYPPSLDPLNPPFARPTSSIDTRSQPPWPASNQPSVHHSQNSLPSGPGTDMVPSTPKTPRDGRSATPNLITPTQPTSAPAIRMLRPRRIAGASPTPILTASLRASEHAATLPSDLLVPESSPDRSMDLGVSGNVEIQALLPALTLSRHQGKGKLSPEIPPESNQADSLSPSENVYLPRQSIISPSPGVGHSVSHPDLVEDSDDLPLGSLPNVESRRGRKSSIRAKIQRRARSLTPDSESESARDDIKEGGLLTEGSDYDGSDHEERPSPRDSLASDQDDEEESQAIPGRADAFGIKRRRGTYASLSPAKSSRKRARLAERIGRVSVIPPSSTSSPASPAPLRVLAPWKGDGHYYCGTIRTVNKAGKYMVEYDDGERATVALGHLRTFLQVGDVLEVLQNPHNRGGMGTVTIVHDTRSEPRGVVSVKLIQNGEVVAVDSKYLRVPKDVHWKGNRRVSSDSILLPTPPANTAPRQPQTRAKSRAIDHSPSRSNLSLRRKPGYRDAPTLKVNFTRARSFARSANSDAGIAQAQHSIISHSKTFARTVIITTQVSPDSKVDMLSKIRRAGGKVVENWDDILSFGSGWADIRWRNVSTDGKLDQIVLLSPDSAQTPKYMMALALGVPCVSEQWAWDRLRGDDVDWRTFLHVAGKSERLGIYVSQVFDPRWGNGSEHSFDPRLSINVRRPFTDKSFLLILCSRGTENREMIRKVVCAAGAASAELVKSINKAKKPLDHYDIVVVDSRQKGLETEATRNGAKRCEGVSWVKQCIIMGALQSFS